MTRYAVYAVPGDGPEDAPGAEIGRRVRELADAWYASRPGITVDPRRYGFHGTLKAPFRLAEGVSAAQLDDAVAAFAAARRPVRIPSVRPSAIGRFRALVPGSEAAELTGLAADVVRGLDHLRAPLTEAEHARRRPERLTPRQRELLVAWGYPYVLDEFRFHLTLTDPIPDDRAEEIDAAIRLHFAEIAGADVPLTALSVFVEPRPGEPFQSLSVHPFASEEQK